MIHEDGNSLSGGTAVPKQRRLSSNDVHGKSSPTFRYGPCRRNHAVATGGNSLDGCQEFDPDCESAKTCAACGCHRSFHLQIPENMKSELLTSSQLMNEARPSFTSCTQFLSPTHGVLSPLSPEDSCRENIIVEKQTGPLGVISLARGRKPCRSRQLRTKACQIWGEYVRPLTAAEGITIRFCDSKDVCVAEMQKGGHPSCAAKRAQLKWPDRVPFTHPKDFTSKELQAFINSYERSWQEYRLCPHGLLGGHPGATSSVLPRIPRRDLDPCKVSTKELRYWLRESGKPVFCVHPKAANQFVNMGKLATMILRKGGKCKFEAASGWDLFVTSSEGMNKPSLSFTERRRCIRTVKRLYNKYMVYFVQETLKEMGLENDGDLALAEISETGANDDEDVEDSGPGDANSDASGSGQAAVYLRGSDGNGAVSHQSLGPLHPL